MYVRPGVLDALNNFKCNYLTLLHFKGLTNTTLQIGCGNSTVRVQCPAISHTRPHSKYWQLQESILVEAHVNCIQLLKMNKQLHLATVTAERPEERRRRSCKGYQNHCQWL